ncbi:unnamed protein product [Phaedon cochleariae]|uniref:Uncharacterized protein n=1 Tax=Phaedon cochleariae TaxID=80249 RepID=A0A9N9SAL8_PHACE|nr:unnamed protein product [Phaedon cochleariae]
MKRPMSRISVELNRIGSIHENTQENLSGLSNILNDLENVSFGSDLINISDPTISKTFEDHRCRTCSFVELEYIDEITSAEEEIVPKYDSSTRGGVLQELENVFFDRNVQQQQYIGKQMSVDVTEFDTDSTTTENTVENTKGNTEKDTEGKIGGVTEGNTKEYAEGNTRDDTVENTEEYTKDNTEENTEENAEENTECNERDDINEDTDDSVDDPVYEPSESEDLREGEIEDEAIVRDINIDKGVTDLASVFDPRFCDNTLIAINRAARFDSETCNYGAPTVAFSLGSMLKQIGKFLINECIKTHQEDKKKNAKSFLKLLTEEINISVNRNVTESQVQMRRRQKVVLPSTEDIKKLHKFLSNIRQKSLADIRKKFSVKVWMQLAEATLMSVQLFNRRRAGEVERILVEDFNSYQSIDEESNKDLFQSLNDSSKRLANRYVRFAIRCELNRTVPVLLDQNLLECIKTINNHRGIAGVPVENPYVFGIRGRMNDEFKYLRACSLMRKFSEECGAEHPERLRGTKLRKHIATTCITLNLEEQEISDLANFMGHAENIHKNIYRQPISRDIIRMSKLLEVAQGGLNNDNSYSENSTDDGPIEETITTPISSRNPAVSVEKKSPVTG